MSQVMVAVLWPSSRLVCSHLNLREKQHECVSSLGTFMIIVLFKILEREIYSGTLNKGHFGSDHFVLCPLSEVKKCICTVEI